MPLGIRIILFVFGVVLFAIIFELVRRRRFREEMSIAWFGVAIALMASSAADKIIDPFAKSLHIGYPPALVFAWIIFCLILALLYFSSVISDLKGKIKELSQKIALMELEIDKQDRGAANDDAQ
jgi:tellurite resistance protein TehA-like permease